MGEVFARVLIFCARDGFGEGFSRFSEVSRMFFMRVRPPKGQVGGEL